MEIKTRDITLIDRGNSCLVIGCDSCGGVGEKPLDLVKASPEIVGYYTTRVALMEVFSVGATPLSVVNTLSVEMEPTGRRILGGIRQLLQEADLSLDILNGSTEENFEMQQTAMGITVMGEVSRNHLKIGTAQGGDLIMLLGLPKVGSEIKQPYDDEIGSLANFMKLVQHPQVGDIIPVGSKGIYYEAQLLAALNHRQLKLNTSVEIDINKTAGPATSIIFSVSAHGLEDVSRVIDQPLYKIGLLGECL